jgi:hypothetical protein
MSATIKVFRVGQKCFTHVMNTFDDSVELRDEDNEVLLIYRADAKVTNQQGRMGDFHVEYLDGQPRWVYYENALQTRIVLGPDLPTAEVEVSKRYIGQSGPFATECAQAMS